jgi:Cation efflux family
MTAVEPHNHEHHHDHRHRVANGRYLALAVLLLLGFRVVEVTTGILAKSLALISAADHMLTDIGSIGLALVAMRLLASRSKLTLTPRRESERAERCDVKTDHILLELKRIAFFDIRALLDPKTKQQRTDPWSKNLDDLRALVNFDIVVLDHSGRYIVKLNPGGKIKALELLGKYKRLFTDKVEHGGAASVTFSTDFGEGVAAVLH